MELSEQKNSIAKDVRLDIRKWRGLVEAWDATKENQKTYCQRLGISLHTFCYVRRKLTKKQKSPLEFIPITLSPSEPIHNRHKDFFILENPGGFKLHISPSLSLEQLTKLFKLTGW